MRSSTFRTPLEFAEDHIPGAINAPVLSNEERGDRRHDVQAGVAVRGDARRRCAGRAQYRAASGHDVRRPSAQLASADLLLARRQALRFGDDALQHDRLAGTAARRRIQDVPGARLSTRCPRCPERSTTSRWSATRARARPRLLHALRQAGAQALDLEDLACPSRLAARCMAGPGRSHRRKAFDTAPCRRARADRSGAGRVFVESESRAHRFDYVARCVARPLSSGHVRGDRRHTRRARRSS